MIDKENRIISDENLCLDQRMIEEGYTILDSNLSQMKVHTPILEGVKGLVFKGCNLKNCDLPEDAQWKDGDNLVCNEDVYVKSQEEIDLDAKKAETEQKALEDYRSDVQTELAKAATVEDIDLQAIKEAIATKTLPIKDPGKLLGGIG